MSNRQELKKGARVFLDVDGVSVPLNAFTQNIFENTVLGMVASLKEVSKDPYRITLNIVRKECENESQ